MIYKISGSFSGIFCTATLLISIVQSSGALAFEKYSSEASRYNSTILCPSYKNDVLQAAIRDFNFMNGERLKHEQVEKYHVLDTLRSRFPYGHTPGAACLESDTLVSFHEGRWLVPFNQMRGYNSVSASLQSNVRDAITQNDLMLAFPLGGTTNIVVFRNDAWASNVSSEKRLPVLLSWDDIYENAIRLSEEYQRPVFIPNWRVGRGGIVDSFVAEIMNRRHNKGLLPSHLSDEMAKLVLEKWKELVDKKVVPDSVFDRSERELIQLFESGRFLFRVGSLRDAFSDTRLKSPNNRLVSSLVSNDEYLFGMLEVETLALISGFNNTLHSTTAILNFIQWFVSPAEKKSKQFYHEWLVRNRLFSGFESGELSKTVNSSLKHMLPDFESYDLYLNLYENSVFPANILNNTWSYELRKVLESELLNWLAGRSKIDKTLGVISAFFEGVGEQKASKTGF